MSDDPPTGIDDRIDRAIEALYDAAGWAADKNYEQAYAAVEEARGILYGVEEELDTLSRETA
jgi:hypothetical protein